MKLEFNRYQDSVAACWVGKNIGGTMGAPHEGRREMLDIQGFVTEAGVALPNDDLDLQLVWLYALEHLGPKNISAATLGEFWLSYVIPHWNEYGICKANMSRGFAPPLAGDYDNNWQHSNGAWIRTEVWACLAPGCPEVAAKYAIEDAKVDHGCGEGTYAAAFVAAMQSAAFVVKDLDNCIDIGLCAIPEDCAVAKSVRLVRQYFREGKDYAEARNAVLALNAHIGDGWFESPSNVAYTVLGLLYGQGDFKKSMILAINCGDDTDCTGATVGATLGILSGTAVIPEDWKAHIGDTIVTICINRCSRAHYMPKTCTELTQRLIRQTPTVLSQNGCGTELSDRDEIPEDVVQQLQKAMAKKRMGAIKPYSVKYNHIYMESEVSLDRPPEIAPDGEIGVTVDFFNTFVGDNINFNLQLNWILPEGFTVRGGRKALRLAASDAHHNAQVSSTFTLVAGASVEAVNRCVLEVLVEGRYTPIYLPVVLLG